MLKELMKLGLQDTLRALADPIRREILSLLFWVETWLFWAYNLGVEKKEEISL